MMLSRRGLITGLLGALATPAIVRADNLMRVRGIIVPRGTLMLAPHNYSFSAWVRSDKIPSTMEMSMDGVVQSVMVTTEWTRVRIEGKDATSIKMRHGSRVQHYAMQLEKTA